MSQPTMWQDLIDKRLKDVDTNLDEDEPLARSEKAAALAENSSHRECRC